MCFVTRVWGCKRNLIAIPFTTPRAKSRISPVKMLTRNGFAMLGSVLSMCMVPSCQRNAPIQPQSISDTSSNNVVWRIDTIGDGSSEVTGLSIINDSEIWASGQFYLKDSVGNLDSTLYNVLRWDGSKWNPQRLYFDYQGSHFLRMGKAVFAFASDDVWIAADAPEHWDGQKLNNVNLGSSQWSEVAQLWGRSSSDLYAVCYAGKMFHFDGSSFQIVPTGVQSRFTDAYGDNSMVYVTSEIYDNQVQPSGVFSMSGSGFRFLFPDAGDKSSFGSLQNSFSVWVSPQKTLWATGASYIFKPNSTHEPVWGSSSGGWLLFLRGTSDWDVWSGGVNGLIVHYNGQYWRQFDEVNLGATYIEYHSGAVKGKTIVLGGLTLSPQHAIIALGTRTE